MDILVKSITLTLVFLNWLSVILQPFLIGKSRRPYDAKDCISSIIGFVLVFIIAGRIFNKW